MKYYFFSAIIEFQVEEPNTPIGVFYTNDYAELEFMNPAEIEQRICMTFAQIYEKANQGKIIGMKATILYFNEISKEHMDYIKSTMPQVIETPLAEVIDETE
jgi:hypothetical protein